MTAVGTNERCEPGAQGAPDTNLELPPPKVFAAQCDGAYALLVAGVTDRFEVARHD